VYTPVLIGHKNKVMTHVITWVRIVLNEISKNAKKKKKKHSFHLSKISRKYKSMDRK
jgi:hypothetical protein